MSIGTLTTGDDSIIPVQLSKGGSPFVINGTATIQASVVTSDKETILIAATPVLEDVGSLGTDDWLNSLIEVRFTQAQTEALNGTSIDNLDSKTVELEIEVDESATTGLGKLTWFVKIKLIKGTINV
jgi:hypothetical protein